MGIIRKFREKISKQRGEESNSQTDQNTGIDSSSQPSNATQLNAPGPSANPSSANGDPWALAYELLETREPELLADYKKHLASLQGASSPTTDTFTPRSVEKIVTQQLEDRKSKQWHFALLGKDIQVREQVEKLTKFLLWTDPIVQNAISAQPFAALAWSGVSLLLPLLTSGTIQDMAMLKGFNTISGVQLYWEICEQAYLQSKSQGDYRGLKQPLVDLYSQIIEYQARVICHLSKAQLSRAWDKLTGADDWDHLATQVQRTSEGNARLIDPLREAEVRERWKCQLKEMQESREILDEIRSALRANGQQAQNMYADENERELLHDLASISNYSNDKDFNPRRVDGTCEWFFIDRKFCQWRDGNAGGLLWVTAGPGCGKSVLSRTLIDERRLSTSVTTSSICYFFFKDGDMSRTHGTDALCAMLHQLIIQDPSGNLIKKALPLHRSHGRSLTQKFSELWQILLDCAASTDAGEIVCIIDALDECESNSRRQLISHLEDFYSSNHSFSKLRFLITSRPYSDIEASFEDFSAVPTYMRFDGDEKSIEISHDIDLVIDHGIRDITKGFTEEDRRKIADRLKITRGRTYLWLYLTLDAIKQAGSRRLVDVETVLGSLADTIADGYEKMLDRSTNRLHTEKLLQIILAAERALTIDEANIALTLALRDEPCPSFVVLRSEMWPSTNFKDTVSDLCGLLVSTYDSKLSFLHQTAREFLLDPRRQGYWRGRFNILNCHEVILRSCFDYLVIPELDDRSSKEAPKRYIEYDHDSRPTEYHVLFPYSSRYWHVHYIAQQSRSPNLGIKGDSFAMALTLCNPELEYLRKGSAHSLGPYWFASRNPSELGAAVCFGLLDVVRYLIDVGTVHVDATDILGYTPLAQAAFYGHEGIVRLLLDTNNVDVNARNLMHETPLFMAAKHGHENIVKLLLDTSGIAVNCRAVEYDDTPLLVAVSRGHQNVVRNLLGAVDIDVNITDRDQQTPLHTAVELEDDTIVKLLLDAAAVDANCRNKDGKTPLQLAVDQGMASITKLLIESGSVDTSCTDKDGLNPLTHAVYYASDTMVELLLETGKFDANARDSAGETPLELAVWLGTYSTVKLMLDSEGGNFDPKSEIGLRVISRARDGEHESLAQFLESYVSKPTAVD